ncbi:Uncharacterised protein [Clostridioides difficile]|uniref:hypothetical protein n=1 Tax=Clostridioides difficile TaxID=1496 RepID=UPI001027151A|nr:hypothetical protein [Clostridioides difficile]VFC58633.1 Uncharacterised protein [Clostridioides difficile]
MFMISYFKHETGNYFVTLQVISQTIVLLPGFFVRVMQLQHNASMGCCEVDIHTLVELGFVVPEHMLLKTV